MRFIMTSLAEGGSLTRLLAFSFDWLWPSFCRHVALGQYTTDWGMTAPAMPARMPPE